jgi:hypothetical protein
LICIDLKFSQISKKWLFEYGFSGIEQHGAVSRLAGRKLCPVMSGISSARLGGLLVSTGLKAGEKEAPFYILCPDIDNSTLRSFLCVPKK